MSRAMIQAAVTMGQLQNKLDVVGNNLANSQTHGYKRKQSEFSSMLVSQINHLQHESQANPRQTAEGIRVGSGARLGAIRPDETIGSFKETERGLDLALQQPNHFFQVEVNNGGEVETHYTRDGAFYLQPVNDDTEVMLTNANGHPILGDNGPITIANGFDAIEITDNGRIVTTRNAVEQTEGRIETVAIQQPSILENTGDNMLRIPTGETLNVNGAELIQPVTSNEPIIAVGALEQSNVDIADEMNAMIIAQRSYQSNARTITMGDQMYGLINQLR